jgi:ribosomal-protein-alanine N-acetyltransferase
LVEVKLPCTVTLRPARLLDVPALATMSRELIETGLAWRYTPARMAAMIRHRETIGLVACDGAQIHGFAVMHFGEDDAHLVLLCVQPAQRHRHIGRGLVEWLLESARVAGLRSVGLELRADNASAMAFYQRLGFVQTDWLPGYYGGELAGRRMNLALRTAPE